MEKGTIVYVKELGKVGSYMYGTDKSIVIDFKGQHVTLRKSDYHISDAESLINSMSTKIESITERVRY